MLRPSLSAVFNGVFFCSGTAIRPAPHTLAREKRDAEVPPRLAPARRRLRLLAAPKQPAPRAPCFMGSLQIAGERTSLAIIARSFATGGVLLSDRAIRDDGTQDGQCPQRPPPPHPTTESARPHVFANLRKERCGGRATYALRGSPR